MSGCAGWREVDLFHEVRHKDLVLLQKHSLEGDLAHLEIQEWLYSIPVKYFLVVISVKKDLSSERHLLHLFVFLLKNDLTNVVVLESWELHSDKDSVPVLIFLNHCKHRNIEKVTLRR